MFLNGIDFPNQIIDAIKEDRLVVFAGAGALLINQHLYRILKNWLRKLQRERGILSKKEIHVKSF